MLAGFELATEKRQRCISGGARKVGQTILKLPSALVGLLYLCHPSLLCNSYQPRAPHLCWKTFLFQAPALTRADRLTKLASLSVSSNNTQLLQHLCQLLTSIKTMASSSMVNSAVVILAVMSSVAVMANAQAPAPAPTSAGFSIVPSVLAPAMGMLVAFFASRMLW